MKYPYIGKGSRSGAVFLFFKESEALTLDSGSSAYFGCVNNICETLCTNITTEYLANTYGEVKSKEHAEFIVKLSGGDSSSIGNSWSQSLKCFVIDSDGKVSFGSRVYYQEKVGKREITIPLPPERDVNLSGDGVTDDTEAVASMLGMNVRGCEWPKVGDDVLFQPNPSQPEKIKAIIKYVGDKFTILQNKSGREFSRRNAKLLIEKIKTPEQEFYTDMERIINTAMKATSKGVEFHIPSFLDEALCKYEIKKKPQ